MPTIVDSLIVTLGLDAAKYKAGQAEAAGALKKTVDAAGAAAVTMQAKGAQAAKFFGQLRDNGNTLNGIQQKTDVALKSTSDTARRKALEMSASGKIAGEYFSNIKEQALGLMTVLLGGAGLAAFTSKAVVELAGMGRAAHNMGESVPELASFRNAVEANGGSAEAAAGSFQSLADNMAAAKIHGTTDILPSLGAIGGDINDAPMQTYMKFVKFAEEHKDNVGLIRQVGMGLHLDEGSVNEAQKGTAQVTQDLAEAKTRGVPTQGMTDDMAKLQGAFARARQAADNLGNVLLDRLAPGLTAALNAITAFIVAHPTAATAGGVALGGGTAAAGLLGTWALIKRLFGGGAAGAGEAASGAGAETAAAAETAASGGIMAAAAAGIAVSVGALAVLFGGREAINESGPLNKFITWLDRLTGLGKLDEAYGIHSGGDGAPRAPTSEADTSGAADATPGPAANAAEPRGIRNNNPGNLNFAGQEGATRESGPGGRFAMFATMAQGVAALGNQLQRYAARGKDTIESIIKTYAPGSENDTPGYIAHMVKVTGFRADQHLDTHDPATLAALERGIISMENGAKYANVVNSARGGMQMAQNDNRSNDDGGQTVHVNGPITIHSQATDAKGIARDLRGALTGRKFATQANTGLA